MNREQKAEDRGQIVRRKAIILCSMTIAECPIAGDCISFDEETKRKTVCGHYAGSITTRDGSQVYCEYLD